MENIQERNITMLVHSEEDNIKIPTNTPALPFTYKKSCLWLIDSAVTSPFQVTIKYSKRSIIFHPFQLRQLEVGCSKPIKGKLYVYHFKVVSTLVSPTLT